MAEKPLSQVYLFVGDDVLKQEMLLKRLSDRIVEMGGDLSMNSQTFTAKDITQTEQLLGVLNTMPFGSCYRFVTIKEADHLNKETVSALLGYIARPLDTTILVLVAEKLAKTTRLYKAIHDRFPSSIVECGQKKRNELPQLIKNIAKTEGVDISPNAARLLIDRVGSSTVMLNNETRKVAAIVKSRGKNAITEEDVTRNVARLAEPKLWELTNALALRDTASCLEIIDRMKSFTAAGIFVQCVIRIREILTAQVLQQRGQSVTRALNKQDWQIKELLQGATLYSQRELEALLKEAPGIEQRMKSGADADHLLRLWVINACVKKSRSIL